MLDEGNKLKLGKGSALVKRDLRQLPQTEDVWEADFLSLPRKGPSQEWLGIVVNRKSKFAISTQFCLRTPTVNDLASLLSNAMRRPVIEVEKRQRPARIYLRDDPRWAELMPHLEQLGIEVATAERLTLCENEAADLIGRVDQRSPAKRRRPAGEPDVGTQYPNVAEWVNGYGRIEIGIHDGEGFQARVFDGGGLIYENADCDSLAGAMQELEDGLGEWFEEQDQ